MLMSMFVLVCQSIFINLLIFFYLIFKIKSPKLFMFNSNLQRSDICISSREYIEGERFKFICIMLIQPPFIVLENHKIICNGTILLSN